jgi:hypothetical protein
MHRMSIFDRKPPLSMLTASQLLDLAGELLEMAATASTVETQQALSRVAARYVARAAELEAEERRATRHYSPVGNIGDTWCSEE